ncbi:DNA transfer protein [Paraburkholderia sacchari]|uniref:hypothetical protein n=1 Tax=Paraburkholderia sacchari TaxID=159450 RepID=UPI0039A6AC42
MPFGAIAGGLAAGIGGSLVSGLMSPGTSGGGSSGQYYIPTGLGTADNEWQKLLDNINGLYQGQNLNQYGLNSLWTGFNAAGQYGPQYQNAANQAGQGYNDAAGALTRLGNLDLATQQQLLGAGQQVFNMGLDPQRALYDRTLNQLTQQTGATNSMYGLGSSAAGAGVQNQALSNFNIDWQNNQLSRALQGLQGYTGAATTGGQYGQAGANALTQAPQYTLAGGSVPFNTAQTISAVPGNLANTYGQFLNQNVYGPAEGMQNSIIQYMNNGNGAQAVPFQSQAAGAGAAGSMISQGFQNAGTALGNYFNGGGYTGDFSGSTPYSSGGFYDPTTFGPSGYGGGFSYGGSNSYGFTM